MLSSGGLGERSDSLWAGRFGGGGPLYFCAGRAREGPTRVSDEEVVKGEPQAGAQAREADLAEIAKALREIVNELKEVNTSLKAIARSQAHQATQKRQHNP